MSAGPDGEWTTRQADQLHVGDHIAGDMLPLGQPGEVIFTRFFEDRRSGWMFVAFAQWDGFHDSTTFLASAPVRVRIVEPQRVADPTLSCTCPLGPEDAHFADCPWYDGPICTPERRLDHGHTIACGPMADPTGLAYPEGQPKPDAVVCNWCGSGWPEPRFHPRSQLQHEPGDPTGLAYTRADDEADDPTPVSGGRVPPHTGAMTDEGLVDETAEIRPLDTERFGVPGMVTCSYCIDRVMDVDWLAHARTHDPQYGSARDED